jgi:hypothetical protein
LNARAAHTRTATTRTTVIVDIGAMLNAARAQR